MVLSARIYIPNKKCKECHETIYKEYQHSAHSLSYFTDELHRKVANASNPKTYLCATCHMPSSGNIQNLLTGKERPDPRDIKQRDGVSCFFCHTIAYVKKAHHFNINIPAKQAKGYKPSLFGTLNNPNESNKHSSLKSPIYLANVCIGCHSHKINDNNVTLFRAIKEDAQNSKNCIKCHMPKVIGGVERHNNRNRTQHRSHRFRGIRDAKFRATGYEIKIEKSKKGINVTLINKMPHPMIIQPARAKYLQTVIKRKNKIIWRNYKKEPSSDSQAYFVYHFFKNGHPITIPTLATSSKVNNLEGDRSKKLSYKISNLKKGDIVEVTLFVRLAKKECLKVISLEDKSFTTPMIIKRVKWRYK